MNLKPVQLTGAEKVCVLVHKDTQRILCFCLDNDLVKPWEQQGFVKHAIHHAHEFDTWAKRWRAQTEMETQAEDAAYLERENAVRQRLRADLKGKLLHASVAERSAIDSALHCLDYAEDKRKRYRAESFMVKEAYEDNPNVGEEIINQVMGPKSEPKVRVKQ